MKIKFLIIIIFLNLANLNRTYSVGLFDTFYLNLNSNHIKSINNNYHTNNLNISLHHDIKYRFTHVPDGTSYNIYKTKFLQLGLITNIFESTNEYKFGFSFFENSGYYLTDREVKSNFVMISDFKILSFKNDIFRRKDYEWINVSLGSGYSIYRNELDFIIVGIFAGAGYSTIQPKKQTTKKLEKFSRISFSDFELKTGVKIYLTIGSLELEGTSSYRRIFEINPDLEIIENRLRIGYSYFAFEEFQGIDSFQKDYLKIFSISFQAGYDILKVNSLMQPQSFIGLNLDANHYLFELLYNWIFVTK